MHVLQCDTSFRFGFLLAFLLQNAFRMFQYGTLQNLQGVRAFWEEIHAIGHITRAHANAHAYAHACDAQDTSSSDAIIFYDLLGCSSPASVTIREARESKSVAQEAEPAVSIQHASSETEDSSSAPLWGSSLRPMIDSAQHLYSLEVYTARTLGLVLFLAVLRGELLLLPPSKVAISDNDRVVDTQPDIACALDCMQVPRLFKLSSDAPPVEVPGALSKSSLNSEGQFGVLSAGT